MEKNKKDLITRQLQFPVEMHVREAGEDGKPSRTITGYSILFNTPSDPLYEDEDEEVREIIDPSAVTTELLDSSDIKFTMFHDMHLILARSKNGKGTLQYKVDEKGVYFEFEAPNTVDGDKALELVRRGDMTNCSFMFSTHYYDDDFVSREVNKDVGGKAKVVCRVKVITGIYDMTLTTDPAYPATDASVRDKFKALLEDLAPKEGENKMQEQLREMRRAASAYIV